VSPNGARGTSASESARTYLPLKLASLAALLGAFMSLALVSVSACLVGVRTNPHGARLKWCASQERNQRVPLNSMRFEVCVSMSTETSHAQMFASFH
jgi:hypothetical protein